MAECESNNVIEFQVDESGAEAVAITLYQVVPLSAKIGPPKPQPVPFVVDHPFVFAILSPVSRSQRQLPIFMGHCLEPVRKACLK